MGDFESYIVFLLWLFKKHVNKYLHALNGNSINACKCCLLFLSYIYWLSLLYSMNTIMYLLFSNTVDNLLYFLSYFESDYLVLKFCLR